MDTSTAVVAAVAAGNPGSLLGAMLVVILLLIPIVIKMWNWSKETSAQGMLYTQLSEQVQKQRDEIEKVYIQRTILQEQVFELRTKVEHLTACESTIDILKNRLDQKDTVIAERDARINNLMQELLKMKDRVHNLEIRLKADEAKFCEGCKYRNVQYIPPMRSTRNTNQDIVAYPTEGDNNE